MPHRTFPLRDCLGKAVWIGLGLLVLGQLDFELSRPCASAGRKEALKGKWTACRWSGRNEALPALMSEFGTFETCPRPLRMRKGNGKGVSNDHQTQRPMACSLDPQQVGPRHRTDRTRFDRDRLWPVRCRGKRPQHRPGFG